MRRGTLTNLSHLVIGATEYALTYVPQTDYTISSLEGSPQADYYTFTSTAPPAGAWLDVRLKTTSNAFIPAIVNVKSGWFKRESGVWLPYPDPDEVVKNEVLPFALREPRRVAPFFNPSAFWEGENASYEGITTKDANALYFTD